MGDARDSKDRRPMAGSKRKWHDGQTAGNDKSQKRQRGDRGRSEWSRDKVDKRARNNDKRSSSARRKEEGKEKPTAIYATKFSQEEIDSQDRKPKRKVAVMIGYAGTGYKGMQLNPVEKTIEGDLFAAFVAAGAISKANADDPQKSSFVRCARTDKGVHAAGNVISLKLIVEDPEIVKKINDQLCPQIRVWGYERTNNAFSAYQFCDSRQYEYLIPTYCFLPPHPHSFLGKNIQDLAKEAGDLGGYNARQKDVFDFWSEQEKTLIWPLFAGKDQALTEKLLRLFHAGSPPGGSSEEELSELNNFAKELGYEGKEALRKQEALAEGNQTTEIPPVKDDVPQSEEQQQQQQQQENGPLGALLRHLRHLHIKIKKSYRIHPDRLSTARDTLSRFTGTHNFHNYTVEKTYHDRSANRVMKSLVISPEPIIINDTEWLSIKIHGQSFMMHQIRKMVCMTALIVRCGCPPDRIRETFTAERISVPKAPSLGLLLERPVFESYNKKLTDLGRQSIEFDKYSSEMEDFKRREIYGRIFAEEDESNTFSNFFSGLDHTRSAQLFYFSSLGLEAAKRKEDTSGNPIGLTARPPPGNGVAVEGTAGAPLAGPSVNGGSAFPNDVDQVVSEDEEEAHDEGS